MVANCLGKTQNPRGLRAFGFCPIFLAHLVLKTSHERIRMRHRRPDRFRRLDIPASPQKSAKTTRANDISLRQRATFGPQLLVFARCPIASLLNTLSAFLPNIVLANRLCSPEISQDTLRPHDAMGLPDDFWRTRFFGSRDVPYLGDFIPLRPKIGGGCKLFGKI